ncbi:helix-hairpin-helix domain-containing protein [Streptomyces sp. P9(2023)]|uniref:helix-hairpin-helix domain-containing protein n=1 Tax=Streptomyces sp. P9(2023) TaxID=3064394 RepID=UPI0028F42048|nr:helix-hairpin-helix domain-containing protein [Streptomyces sp. P9(2023)]MDT9691548.1 helix-hairpin-helix domain-containing protein [Streptomyces sp. P9(2023)]
MTEPSRETPPEATEPEPGETDEAAAELAPEAGEEASEASDGAVATADGEAKAAEVSEAQAELAAQRELRARIEQRKAEKAAPVDAGAKLSGTAAELLAAVRAVESGTKSGAAFVEAPTPTSSPEPRRPAPVPAPAPAAAPRPAAQRQTASPETLTAVREVLAHGGAPESLTGQVAATLGEGAAEALRDDPWLLLSVPGVQPEHADGFARALLGAECGPGDPRRAVALVTWLLERAALKGHTALEDSAVRAELAKLSVPDPDEAVREAAAEGAVLLFQEEEPAPEAAGDEDEGGDEGEDDEPSAYEAAEWPDVPALLGLDRYALAEESLADGLARLVKTVSAEVWEGPELVTAAGAHGLVLHTGGEAARSEPVALAEAARERGLRVAVATHSENGVQRLGGAALTVAALLSGAAGPGRDEDGALALDLLVVLDAPQLDVESATTLVESLPDGCRLVLSGDPDVLGSAGAGRVFADVLAAGVCPRIASRVPDPGPIGELVSGIGIGELNQVEAPGKEVVIVPVRDAGEAVHRTVQLVADSIPRAIDVPAEQTQVITVGHGGSAGTRALNAALKQRLNPGPGRFGGFDPGDRVTYVPAPGRTVTGTVVGADADGLRLECAGEPLVVPKERVESALRHGWALTAHQAAGMRWPAAVVVLPGDAAQGLSRAWVYTAFGRGERHLSVVHGVDQALPRAVAEGVSQERTTRLRPLLEALLAAEED